MACSFCEIVAGEQPADVVLATEDVVAFLDRRPVFKGHVLLVPRQHVHTLTDLPDELVVPLLTVTRTLARAVVERAGRAGLVRGD